MAASGAAAADAAVTEGRGASPAAQQHGAARTLAGDNIADAPSGRAQAEAEEEEEDKDLPNKQYVIFIRHAESRWNRAQEDYSLMNMMWENDHGLSEDGRRQAEELRRRLRAAARLVEASDAKEADANNVAPAGENDWGKEQERANIQVEYAWLRRLLNPDAVFSSPFTRAICTACLGLRDLLTEDRQLVLLKEAREQKNIGGADSTGVATGEDIRQRVTDEVSSLYEEDGEAEKQRALQELAAVRLDASGCEDEWWGALTGDSEGLILERIVATLRRLRRTRGGLPGGGGVSILVGHSLFLKTTFLHYLSGGDRPEPAPLGVASSLRSQLLPYCGVIGAQLEWDRAGKARITEVLPLLGTQLKESHAIALAAAAAGPQPPRGQLAQLTGCVCSRKAAPECSVM